jgi:hypothetical protein
MAWNMAYVVHLSSTELAMSSSSFPLIGDRLISSIDDPNISSINHRQKPPINDRGKTFYRRLGENLLLTIDMKFYQLLGKNLLLMVDEKPSIYNQQKNYIIDQQKTIYQ